MSVSDSYCASFNFLLFVRIMHNVASVLSKNPIKCQQNTTDGNDKVFQTDFHHCKDNNDRVKTKQDRRTLVASD